MKRIIAIILAMLTLACLAACGPTADNGGDGKDTEAVTADAEEATAEAGSDTAGAPDTSEKEDAGKAGLTGKLVFIDPDGEKIIRGLSLSGNRSGTAEFNSKEPAAEGIRCVFELNEYVGVTPDTDETRMSVYVFKHREDQSSYEKTDLSDPGDECVTVFESERDEDGYWGEFYLNPDEEPGYYDLVFTVDSKAVASLVTRFFSEGELEGKTDAELEKLMHN
ncbi:MAG: hypothetical protein IKG80_05080 [Clostridia bacterium]|nr:hypothetical protein [Clostridia bacterium]